MQLKIKKILMSISHRLLGKGVQFKISCNALELLAYCQLPFLSRNVQHGTAYLHLKESQLMHSFLLLIIHVVMPFCVRFTEIELRLDFHIFVNSFDFGIQNKEAPFGRYQKSLTFGDSPG